MILSRSTLIRFGTFIKVVLILATIFSVCLAEHPALISEATPRVTRVITEDNQLALNSKVSVVISNIRQLLHQRELSGRNILLYINTMPLEETYPYATNPESDTITFFISHTDQPIELWNKIALSRNKKELFKTNVSVSVGFEGGSPIPTDVKRYSLRIAQKLWFYTCIGLIAVFFAGFLYLAFKSSILRDRGEDSPTGEKPPYSLAYVQMAIWFFTIMSSWLMLYVIQHTFNTITDSMVVLLGISSATALGSAAIGTGQRKKNMYSRGFFKDILSDETGATNFHRFQMVAWTFVMVAVFLRQVYFYFCMPDFDASLLVLMGISSGTYLGFKVNEHSQRSSLRSTQDQKAKEMSEKQVS